MLTFTSLVVLIFAITFSVFMNYPPPPESPIIYQWRTIGGHYYQHGDLKIFYKVENGTGNFGTLLCLHGFPTSSFDWFKVWPKLKRHFNQVIAIDFLGLGFSDKPRHYSYSIIEQADIVLEILKLMDVNSTHVLAHDYGDTVALELLARETNIPFFYSTCLLNGGLFPSKHHPTWLQIILRIPIIGTVVSRFGNYYFFKTGFANVFSPTRQPNPEDLSDIWHIIRLQNGYRVLGNLLSYIDERISHEHRWVGALRQTKVPIHMIYGTKDPVNPPPFAEHYRSVVPKPSIQELGDVGHYVQLEAPEEMLNSYITFLSSLPPNEK